jgi:tRNA threonylcarbamoyladenosine biosynthesis protein TsaB
MALILHLETSTTNCSVALSEGTRLLALKELNNGYTHNENLNVFIEEVLNEAGRSYQDLEALSVSLGPGSYTGLRIGVSAAKGLAYALDVPVIGVETLDAFSHHKAVQNTEGLLIPMLDARRMEVYSAIFRKGEKIRATQAEVIDASSYNEYDESILLYGPGADKLNNLFNNHPTISIKSGLVPTAVDLIRPAFEKYQNQAFEDTAYFEPFYLKNFIAGKPKKLIRQNS